MHVSVASIKVGVRGRRVPEIVGLSALRTGRLDTDSTCAVNVPKLMSSIKVPSNVEIGKRPPNPYLPSLVV